MPAFRIQLNGKKVSTIGLDQSGVLTAIVQWIGRADERAAKGRTGDEKDDELELALGGLDTTTDPHEHLRWANRRLKIGDVVSIRIVADAVVDRPVSRKRSDPVKNRAAQKNYVKMMAKKLGWKIQTK